MSFPSLVERCSAKVNRCESARASERDACPTPVDLVVLIDTSDSMRGQANEVAALAQRAVADAVSAANAKFAAAAGAGECAVDLKPYWLGIEGTWPDTQFCQSVRGYLRKQKVPEEALRSRPRNSLPRQGAQEDGARAILDLLHHFNWRHDARRVILYLGDEALAGGDPHDAADVAAAQEAIACARSARVRLFAYAGNWGDRTYARPQTEISYGHLARRTQGRLYTTPPQNLQTFATDLAALLCENPDVGIPVCYPALSPNWHLRWGQALTDRIESDDVEGFCLIASNPYPDVRFRNLLVHRLDLTSASGEPIPLLPDGSRSLEIVPRDRIDFGTLEPWREEGSGWQVAREGVLTALGAIPGEYKLTLQFSYVTEYLYSRNDWFNLELMDD